MVSRFNMFDLVNSADVYVMTVKAVECEVIFQIKFCTHDSGSYLALVLITSLSFR